MDLPRATGADETVENHHDGERKGHAEAEEDADKIPANFEGYLMKKRKWPMKGWHKRYFLLERGQLKYAKTASAAQDEDTLHGSIDLGSSAMATKRGVFKIDLDTEESIYHLKCKNASEFESWTKHLRLHRVYRQNLPALTGSFSFDNNTTLPSSPVRERQSFSSNLMFTPSRTMDGRSLSLSLKRERFRSIHQQSSSVMINPILMTSRVSAWLLDNSTQETSNKELMSVQENLFKLTQLLQNIRLNTPMGEDSNKSKSKKKQRSYHKRKKSDEAKSATQDLRGGHSTGTSSSDNGGVYLRESPFPEISEEDPFDEFIMYSFKVVNNMKALLLSLSTERDRLKEAQELELNRSHSNTHINQLTASHQLLLQQNKDLRARLSRIGKEADLTSMPEPPTVEETPTLMRNQASNDSYLSIAESCCEFYDAEEYFLSSSSSSESDDKSDTESEASDNLLHGSSETLQNIVEMDENEEDDAMDIFTKSQTGRRSCLPAPSPDISDVNMWNILRKNVGKDLSKVAMPVVLNEPLGMLQRLCEELEYSELLDKASDTLDPYERMVHVAAFAVSSYSSLYYRACRKPFNPILGETFECVREDKGFKFFAEQVSHHPPVSACHCESRNFTFWQSCRIKNKFWGRSMEVLPQGTVNVVLPRFNNEHYQWNKVTSSIHNVLGGNRWVENYGEMVIKTAGVTCKIKFVKAGYWSSKLHEFHGCVLDESGEVRHQLFGKWNESMYCGVAPSARLIWRPGSMPDDYELFYSFTRFAVELNEMKASLRPMLPPTDSRFRPDQRALEEGLITLAETEKQRVEDEQRNRKKEREELGEDYQPRFFRKGEDDSQELWVSNDTYWDLRRIPGFSELKNPELW